MSGEAIIATKDERPAFWVMGDRYTVLLSASETGGAFTLFEFVVPPGRGSPPHIHHREDETFLVVAGEVEFVLGGVAAVVGMGAIVFGARGVPHSFRNVGATDARMIVTVTPGGLEAFFAAVGVPAADRDAIPPAPSPAGKERIREIAPAFGIELLRPAP